MLIGKYWEKLSNGLYTSYISVQIWFIMINDKFNLSQFSFIFLKQFEVNITSYVVKIIIASKILMI